MNKLVPCDLILRYLKDDLWSVNRCSHVYINAICIRHYPALSSSWRQPFGSYGYEWMTAIVFGHLSCPLFYVICHVHCLWPFVMSIVTLRVAQVMVCPELYYLSTVQRSLSLSQPLFLFPSNHAVFGIWHYRSLLITNGKVSALHYITLRPCRLC